MTVGLSNTVQSSAFEHFLRQDAVLHGLPSFAYTSEAFFNLESQKLFPENWMFVGFTHDLEQPGDVWPVTAAGRPVVLVHNRSGEINAFQNVCRHRCTQLVQKPGNVGRFLKCPYHAWAYGLDGDLRATPYFGGRDQTLPEGFDKKQYGLVPIRCAVWHDWIFINLNGKAENFTDFIAPLERRLEGIDFSTLQRVGVIDFGEVETNWKFLMENFIEPYHVPVVHPSTTDQPLNDHYTVVDGLCLGSSVDISRDPEQQSKAGSLAVSSRYLTLFPNFVLGRYFPDQLGVHLNLPVSPGKTGQRRAIYMTNGETPNAESAEALKNLWYQVHKEDHDMCDRLYRGRASELAEEGGLLSPYWESSLRRFQELVVEAVR